jgi:hypothetical protein
VLGIIFPRHNKDQQPKISEAVVKHSRAQIEQDARWRGTVAGEERVREDLEALSNAALPNASGFTIASQF